MTVTKRILDIVMTAALLFLMAFQATGQLVHEWLGVAMTALVILHQVLNRRWYGTLFKGKHRLLRNLQIAVNLLLLFSFAATAASGILMSRYAAPFLSGILSVSVMRKIHLSMSHWSFILMGLHIGLHFGMITSRIKNKTVKMILTVLMAALSCYGIYLFISQNMISYLLMRDVFAFFDFSKPTVLVLLENLVMLLTFGSAAYWLSKMLRPHGHNR